MEIRISNNTRFNVTCLIILMAFTSIGCKDKLEGLNVDNLGPVKIPQIGFSPEQYLCPKAGVMNIDGIIDPMEWSAAEWTLDFTDIEGELKPDPLYKTRAKMMWDDSCLYVAAEIYEPHIWGRLKQRDTVIYHDNDFEVFIDPEGDTKDYYELEINSLNTAWDLQLSRPYRDRAKVNNDWNITGLRSAVQIEGTLNNPADIDNLWTIEIAIPFSSMDLADNQPHPGNFWRVNFSRVNWQREWSDGFYTKKVNPETGRNLPEYNWVWSPQGVINMHYPEMWGYLIFYDSREPDKEPDLADEELKWFLRTLYYMERKIASETGRFDKSLIDQISEYPSEYKDLEIVMTENGFEVSVVSVETGNRLSINQVGELITIEE